MMPLRLCVVGDELVAGTGDPRGLGWVGRVAARTNTVDPLSILTLAVPGENTSQLAARWQTETARRFCADCDNRLIVGLGRADAAATGSLARSRLNLANIIDGATSAGIATFVVGPPPLGQFDARLTDLSAAWAEVAARRAVPYVECCAPLQRHEQWLADMNAGDGCLPGQAGYGLITWLILHSGWHTWLNLPQNPVV